MGISPGLRTALLIKNRELLRLSLNALHSRPALRQETLQAKFVLPSSRRIFADSSPATANFFDESLVSSTQTHESAFIFYPTSHYRRHAMPSSPQATGKYEYRTNLRIIGSQHTATRQESSRPHQSNPRTYSNLHSTSKSHVFSSFAKAARSHLVQRSVVIATSASFLPENDTVVGIRKPSAADKSYLGAGAFYFLLKI